MGHRSWMLLAVVALAARVYLERHTAIYDVDVQFGWVALVVSALVSFGQWLAGHAATIAVVIWEVLQKVGVIIWDFAVRVGDVFVSVYRLFGRFWSAVLRPFITWSWNAILRFEGWLRRTFTPVLNFLQMVRTKFLAFYEKWFRPIFQTIDAVRGVLHVLATLHVAFARELDAKLAELEDRLLAPLRMVLARLNEAMNWINRIVTLDGLFQRLTLLASIVAYERDVLAHWWNAQARSLTTDERTILERPWDPTHAHEAQAAVVAYFDSGGGDLAPYITDGIDTAKRYASSLPGDFRP